MTDAELGRIYAGANWHERETWEMFGITFLGHPDLRHIYLPSDFEGYPLRKDFPLLARMVKPWPGIVDVEPMPAGVDERKRAKLPTGRGEVRPVRGRWDQRHRSGPAPVHRLAGGRRASTSSSRPRA